MAPRKTKPAAVAAKVEEPAVAVAVEEAPAREFKPVTINDLLEAYVVNPIILDSNRMVKKEEKDEDKLWWPA
jgi:hypothetical protein